MCDFVTFLSFLHLCCAEGTYVKNGDKIISFSRGRDNRCPPVIISVPRKSIEIEAFVVGFIGVSLSLVMWLYFLYKVYKLWQQFRRRQKFTVRGR